MVILRGTPRKEVPTRFCCGSGGCEVEGSAVVFDDVTDPVNRCAQDDSDNGLLDTDY
jgi:hypothetical protein